jgi:RimJ/RimL family protein N-acetyltransferase
MQISFRDLAHHTDEDYELMAKWDNDPAIRHLCLHFTDEAASQKRVTLEDVQKQIQNSNFKRFMIDVDGIAVGNTGFCIDFNECVTKEPGTAWLGITIGEASARGKGIGKIAMEHLEEAAKNAGAKRFELGVFEFNSVALNLYKKIGYKEIQRIPNFAYWNSRMWDDLRFLKEVE